MTRAYPRFFVVTLVIAACAGVLSVTWVVLREGQGVATERTAHAHTARLAEIDARFRQGVTMLHAGQNDHALVAFHRVLELSPRLPEAHVNLGFALLGLKRYEAARDFFQSAIELRPRQSNAYYGLGMALDRLGDGPGALGAMRTYVHLAPAEAPQVRKARAAIWEWESASPRNQENGASR